MKKSRQNIMISTALLLELVIKIIRTENEQPNM